LLSRLIDDRSRSVLFAVSGVVLPGLNTDDP
jgi:hypothetical protein